MILFKIKKSVINKAIEYTSYIILYIYIYVYNWFFFKLINNEIKFYRIN